MSVIGALRAALHICIERYRHATDAAFFEYRFENRLLKAIPWGEGRAVILGNASFHRRKALGRLARGKARLLFLPPYSHRIGKLDLDSLKGSRGARRGRD